MTRGIYAIQDTLANEIVGGLHMFGADAPAVRFFSDVAAQSGTIVNQHLGDHQLIRIATIVTNEFGHVQLFPEQPACGYEIVISGQTLRAAQAAQTQAEASA